MAPFDRRSDEGCQREDEQHQAREPAGVGVALEDAVVAQQYEHGHEQDHGDGEPGQLRVHVRGRLGTVVELGPLGRRHVDPVDHDEAEDRQQRRHRQQERVGVARLPAHDEMHGESEGPDDARGDPQPAVGLLAVGPADLQGAEDAQAPGEHQQDQLDTATGRLAPHRSPDRRQDVGGRAHGVVPGQPAGGTRVWHSVARLCSSAMMRWASTSSAAGIPLLTSSWSK